MHYAILHREKKAWPKPLNHLDGRVCPTCLVTVHGSNAQRDHHNRHITEAVWRARVNELLEEVCKRTGLTEELVKLAGDDWSWGADVEDGRDDD